MKHYKDTSKPQIKQEWDQTKTRLGEASIKTAHRQNRQCTTKDWFGDECLESVKKNRKMWQRTLFENNKNNKEGCKEICKKF